MSTYERKLIAIKDRQRKRKRDKWLRRRRERRELYRLLEFTKELARRKPR